VVLVQFCLRVCKHVDEKWRRGKDLPRPDSHTHTDEADTQRSRLSYDHMRITRRRRRGKRRRRRRRRRRRHSKQAVALLCTLLDYLDEAADKVIMKACARVAARQSAQKLRCQTLSRIWRRKDRLRNLTDLKNVLRVIGGDVCNS
jgi:hypothetical protein